jgi:ABC-2 type transport system permease protein
VKSLVDAEVLKLRSTRMPAGLLLATLCLEVLTVVVSVPSVGNQDGMLSLHEPDLLARIIGVGLGVPEVMMLLLGVLAFTQEFRYGTASSTFLLAPRRSRVLLAKWLATTIASAPVTVATLAVSFGVAVPLIRSRDGNVTADAELWQVVAAVFAVMAVFGVIGVSVGALVRNQIAAVVGALVWMLAVEQLVTSSYPTVGRWTPLGATFGLLQVGHAVTTKGQLLAAPAGGELLLGYAVVACALAFFFTPRRDVL